MHVTVCYWREKNVLDHWSKEDVDDSPAEGGCVKYFCVLKVDIADQSDRLELAIHECVLCMQCLCGTFAVISKIMT